MPNGHTHRGAAVGRRRGFRRATLSTAFAGGDTGCHRAMIRTHSRPRAVSVMSGKCRRSSITADSSPSSSNTGFWAQTLGIFENQGIQ